MDRSRFFARHAPLVALAVVLSVAGFQHRAILVPWLARDGIALLGGLGILGALIGSWVRVYRGRAAWARVWAPRGAQAHHRFLVLWWGATAAGITLFLLLWSVWPVALLLRLIFALLAVPFALLLVDTVRLFIGHDAALRPGRSWRSLAMMAALGLLCCAYLIVIGPGPYPHVTMLAYVGALAAGGTAATRIGHEAAGAGSNHRGPNEALQTDQREGCGNHQG